MNDKELADRVVALGIGCKADDGKYDRTNWRKNNVTESSITRLCHMFDHQFVCDWRVVGALISKAIMAGHKWKDLNPTDSKDPRAIIEACVEALNPAPEGLGAE